MVEKMTNRPATRSKNKRQKVDDDAAVTSRLFRCVLWLFIGVWFEFLVVLIV